MALVPESVSNSLVLFGLVMRIHHLGFDDLLR